MTDHPNPDVEQARTNLEAAIQEFLSTVGDGRVVRDWIVGYSSVRLDDIDKDITNYGYVFRNHQPLHHSLGIIDVILQQANQNDWTTGD